MKSLTLEMPWGRMACSDRESDGPALLFLHGTGCDLEDWAATLSHVPPRFRAICPEFRDSSLSDVVAWLGAAADMPVALGNVPQSLRDRPLTFRFQNIPADVLLDVLCLEEGLTWRIAEQKSVRIEDKP